MNDFYELVTEETTYTDVNKFGQEFERHLLFKTGIVLYDEKKEAYAICRWNMVNQKTAHLLDLIVRADYKNKGVMFQVTRMGLELWPGLKYLVFERGYDDGKQVKKIHKISIERFLRREQNATIS